MLVMLQRIEVGNCLFGTGMVFSLSFSSCLVKLSSCWYVSTIVIDGLECIAVYHPRSLGAFHKDPYHRFEGLSDRRQVHDRLSKHPDDELQALIDCRSSGNFSEPNAARCQGLPSPNDMF